MIYPYLKSTGVYSCPDDTSSGGNGLTPISYALPEPTVYPTSLGEIAGAISKFTSPPKSVLLFEVQSVTGTNSQSDVGDPTNPLAYTGWVGWGEGLPGNIAYAATGCSAVNVICTTATGTSPTGYSAIQGAALLPAMPYLPLSDLHESVGLDNDAQRQSSSYRRRELPAG